MGESKTPKKPLKTHKSAQNLTKQQNNKMPEYYQPTFGSNHKLPSTGDEKFVGTDINTIINERHSTLSVISAIRGRPIGERMTGNAATAAANGTASRMSLANKSRLSLNNWGNNAQNAGSMSMSYNPDAVNANSMRFSGYRNTLGTAGQAGTLGSNKDRNSLQVSGYSRHSDFGGHGVTASGKYGWKKSSYGTGMTSSCSQGMAFTEEPEEEYQNNNNNNNNNNPRYSTKEEMM